MIAFSIFFSTYATAFAYFASLIIGVLTPSIALAAVSFSFVLALKHSMAFNQSNPDFRFSAFTQNTGGLIEILLACIVIYAAVRHFVWLIYPADHGLSILNPSNYGDLPLHINYIRQMSSGAAFPPLDPEYALEMLRYPFGGDLFNALFEALGVHLTLHLIVVGIVSTVASVVLLRVYAGWWGIGAFFLSGGLAGWRIALGLDPVHDFMQDLQWKNLFLTVFMTQRGMLFALPMSLFLLINMRRYFHGQKYSRESLLALGVVWGMLPLFHAHAFVIVSLILVANAWMAHQKWSELKDFLLSPTALIAYLPATYFVLRTTDSAKKVSIVHWDLLWGSKLADFPQFLVVNFGFWLLVPIAIAWFLSRAEDSEFTPEERTGLWQELALYYFLFVLFTNLMLAPWNWDNIKILIWPYLGFARLASIVIEPKLVHWWRWPVAGLLFFSGFTAFLISLRPMNVQALGLYQDADLAMAQGALAQVPPDAVFSASTDHGHALTYFGRIRIVGYEGHLWSHGIDATDAIAKNERVMKGDPDWLKLCKELKVTYIFWGPSERAKFGASEKPWMKQLQNVSRVPGYEIYAVR